MSLYDLDRIQASQVWVEQLRPLPVVAIGEALLTRANEVLEDEPEGPSRSFNTKRIQLLLDPEAREAYQREQDEARLSTEIGDWLALRDTEEDSDPEDEVDFWEAPERAEDLARLATEQSLLTYNQLNTTLRTAEFGLNFGEDPDGNSWNSGDTMDSLRRAIQLQEQLELPFANDRIQDIAVRGLEPPFRGYAARFLIELAINTKDYQTFLAAGNMYKEAVDVRDDTCGCEAMILDAAVKFIEPSESSINRCAVDIALNALAHYDPVSSFYPLNIARLGATLRGSKA